MLKSYRFTILFVFTGLIVMMSASWVTSYRATSQAKAGLRQVAERSAVADTEHILSMVRNQGSMMGGQSSPAGSAMDMQQGSAMDMQQSEPFTLDWIASPQGLPGTYGMVTEGLNVTKLNLFDLDGTIVWSSDPSSIGNSNHNSLWFQQARDGIVMTKLEEGKTSVTSDGTVTELDIVEVYLPLRSDPSSDPIGVIEVYRDATQDFSGIVDSMGREALLSNATTLGSLFIVLFCFILVANIAINRSRRREKALADARMSEQKRRGKALRQSGEEYRSLVENLSEGVSIRVGRKRVFVNQAYVDIYGLDNKALALNHKTGEFLAPGEADKIGDHLLVVEQGESVPEPYEYRIQRPDGATRTLESVAASTTY